MSCVNCSNAIQKVTQKINGVDEVEVSFANASGRFSVSDNFDEQILVEKIKKLGFGVSVDENEFNKQKQKNFSNIKKRFITALIISIILMVQEHFFTSKLLMVALASIVQFYSGFEFYTHSISALKNKSADMNVLVALGTSAAYFYALAVFIFDFNAHDFMYISSSSMIITFILFGKILEEKSKQKATNYLKKLMDLSANTAIKIDQNNNEVEVLAKELKINDEVIVKAGKQIPSDGEVLFGEADVDTSMLSGESMLCYKKVGDKVYAGTFNQNGFLKIKVQTLPEDTVLFQIIKLLQNSSNKKMPISRLADKIASIFVPSVVGISLLTFCLWMFFDGNFLSAFVASVSVLVISCPCALGLATPISIVNALSLGAKYAILVKNPPILEIVKDIKYVIFDKTGTLTNNDIQITKALCDDLDLQLIAQVASQNDHLISQAISKYAKQKNISFNQTKLISEQVIGRGVRAKVENKDVLIGNFEFLKQNNTNISQEFIQFSQNLSSVVYASIDGVCKGVFELSDSIKQNASELINELKNLNITPVILSGDNEKATKLIAQSLHVEHFYAQKLPHQKHEIIQQFQQNAKVMFVGDGINDSPSLKQADIGIALSSGSDIAKEAGDIVLLNNDILGVLRTIKLSKVCLKNIKQNLFWAFLYNIIGIPVAAGVLYPNFNILLSPTYAAIAMSLSSTIVVLNALRLRFFKLTNKI